MGNFRDFVVSITGEDNSKAAFDAFKDNAGKAAVATAAAFAGMKLGEALTAGLDAGVVNSRLDAALDATPAQAKEYGEAASAVYRDAWGESLDDVGRSVETVVSSIGGLRDASDEDIAAATTSAQALADVYSIDVAQSAGAAGVLIKDGLAKDSVEAFDLMTASLQRVPEAMRGEVIDSVSEYSRNFSALGLSGEQSLGMLTAAAESGIGATDKVGDALKELTIRGTDMSTATGEAYKTLGLDSRDMANQILAGGDTASGALSKIVGGLRGIDDPAKQAEAAIALFGTPLEDLGTNNIPAFLASLDSTESSLGDVAGKSEDFATTLSDNPKTSVEGIKRSVEGWTQSLIDTGGPMGTAAAATMAFGGDALAMGTSLSLGVVALSQLKVGLMAAKVASVASSVATGVATAAQWAYNAALSANPIGLVILAVAALVAGLVWFFTQTETGQKIVRVAWAGIKYAAASVVNWWKDTAWPAIRSTWDKVTGAYGTAKRKIAGFLMGALSVMKRVFGWSPLGLVINNWDRIIGFFRNLPGRMGRAARGLWDPLWNSFRGVLNRLIYAWNSFSLTIGGGSVAGINLPSVTLYTPNIPYLAEGGDIQRTGLAVVGDAGPEILELPRGARVTPLSGNENTTAGRTVNIYNTINYPQAEPSSVTTNRGLQYAAAIGVV